MKYRNLLAYGCGYLAGCEIEEAHTDAWLLLEYVTGMDRAHYLIEQSEQCRDEWEEAYRALLAKRGKRIPLQHLTGFQAFMGLEFAVSEQVLIPRQDTEILAQEALSLIEEGDSVLDMCTGSGCLIISLALLGGKKKAGGAGALYVGADISGEALAVAAANADRLHASVSFVQGDLFENIHGTYDVIVSNPPYIRSREIENLMPEVRDHEPRLALDGSEDGLCFYRRITTEALRFLNPGGRLLFEIGCEQAAEVTALLAAAGYTEIETKKDLAGLDRVVLAKRP